MVFCHPLFDPRELWYLNTYEPPTPNANRFRTYAPSWGTVYVVVIACAHRIAVLQHDQFDHDDEWREYEKERYRFQTSIWEQQKPDRFEQFFHLRSQLIWKEDGVELLWHLSRRKSHWPIHVKGIWKQCQQVSNPPPTLIDSVDLTACRKQQYGYIFMSDLQSLSRRTCITMIACLCCWQHTHRPCSRKFDLKVTTHLTEIMLWYLCRTPCLLLSLNGNRSACGRTMEIASNGECCSDASNWFCQV